MTAPPDHAKDLASIFHKLFGGDPRTLAILAASYIETHLVELIVRRLPGIDAEIRKRLFDPIRGSVSTFGAKIDLARALNVLTDRGRSSALLVAKVRNSFAHNLRLSSFDHAEVAKYIDKMEYHRAIQMTPDGSHDIDNKNMTREEVFSYLVRQFCLDISFSLGGGNWAVSDLEDIEPKLRPRPSPSPTPTPTTAPEGFLYR
ncbi:hypothetical protein [Bradyrhizobium sp. WU425]|uniref:hypothetical protein n=1 Tax=Bradyrhizobium sp. WU425 TaxID=187029 RepID=UPI001E5AEFBC|nr:hypothetical protein [Bradyrhizobium canariense]UFW75200.1 hypothetical protein BcanWU425_16095 [Bradyrhizobium canariense]